MSAKQGRKSIEFLSAKNGTLARIEPSQFEDGNHSMAVEVIFGSEQRLHLRRKSSDNNSRLKRKAVKDTPLVSRKILIQMGENPSRISSRRTSAPLRNGKTVLEEQLKQVYGSNEGFPIYMAGQLRSERSVPRISDSTLQENSKRRPPVSALISKQTSPMSVQLLPKQSKEPKPNELLSLEPYVNQSQKKHQSKFRGRVAVQMAPYDDHPSAQFEQQDSHLNQNVELLHASTENERGPTAQQKLIQNVQRREFKEHLREIVQNQLRASKGSLAQIGKSPRLATKQENKEVLETQRSQFQSKRDLSRQRSTNENPLNRKKEALQKKSLKNFQKQRHESVQTSRVGPLKKEATEYCGEDGKYKDLNKLLVDLINGKKQEERASSQDNGVAKEISSVQASLKDLSQMISQIKINPQGKAEPDPTHIRSTKRSKGINLETYKRQTSPISIQGQSQVAQQSTPVEANNVQQVRVKKGLAFRVDRQSVELIPKQPKLYHNPSDIKHLKQNNALHLRSKSRSNAITNVNSRFDHQSDVTPITIQLLKAKGDYEEAATQKQYSTSLKHKRNSQASQIAHRSNQQLPKLSNPPHSRASKLPGDKRGQATTQMMTDQVQSSYISENLLGSLPQQKSRVQAEYQQKQITVAQTQSQQSLHLQSSTDLRSESQLRGLRHSPLRSCYDKQANDRSQTGTSPLYQEGFTVSHVLPSVREPKGPAQIASRASTKEIITRNKKSDIRPSLNSSLHSERAHCNSIQNLHRPHQNGNLTQQRNSYEEVKSTRYQRLPDINRTDEKEQQLRFPSKESCEALRPPNEKGIFLIQRHSENVNVLWKNRYFNDGSKRPEVNRIINESYASFHSNRSQANKNKSRAQRKKLDFNVAFSNSGVGFTEFSPLKQTGQSLFHQQNNYSTSNLPRESVMMLHQSSVEHLAARKFYTTVNGANILAQQPSQLYVLDNQTQRLITKQQSESRLEPSNTGPFNLRKGEEVANSQEQVIGVYGSVLPRNKQRLDSRNSPKKLALSYVFEEDESAVIQQNLDLQWTPLKTENEPIKPQSKKNPIRDKMRVSQQDASTAEYNDHLTAALNQDLKNPKSQRRNSSSAQLSALHDQAQIERLLAQKRTLKEVSQYRKRGKASRQIETLPKNEAETQQSHLQVSGEHVALKSKPRTRSNARNTPRESKTNLNKSKAIAHLKRHLNVTSDKGQQQPQKSERQRPHNKISQTVTESIQQELQEASLSQTQIGQPSLVPVANHSLTSKMQQSSQFELTEGANEIICPFAMPPTISPERTGPILCQDDECHSISPHIKIIAVKEHGQSLAQSQWEKFAGNSILKSEQSHLETNSLSLTNYFGNNQQNFDDYSLPVFLPEPQKNSSQPSKPIFEAKNHIPDENTLRQKASSPHNPYADKLELITDNIVSAIIETNKTDGFVPKSKEDRSLTVETEQRESTDFYPRLTSQDDAEPSYANASQSADRRTKQSLAGSPTRQDHEQLSFGDNGIGQAPLIEEDQDTIPSDYNALNQSIERLAAQVESPRIMHATRHPDHLDHFGQLGHPNKKAYYATNYEGMKPKQDLKRLDSPTILAAQQRLTSNPKLKSAENKGQSKPKIEQKPKKKAIQPRELYAQLNVPFPQQGNTYEALALLPDFKTRHFEWQGSRDGVNRQDLIWLQIARFSDCFAPSVICKEQLNEGPQLEIFDFF